MKILVTGAAGFIGFHVSKRLLDEGIEVYGIDNINDYYDQSLKVDRLSILKSYSNFKFEKLDISNKEDILKLFNLNNFSHVINLAAQAGVRYSLENPHAYMNSNMIGFLNLLEGCRNSKIEHLLYASSSSVYGANVKIPFETNDGVDHPVSLYAATKKSNELMAHTYSHLYNIPTTGLRFFTVYGPWGRPDMAYFSFTRNIIDNKKISVYNHGQMMRDFTYIDDIVDAIRNLIELPPTFNPEYNKESAEASSSTAPYKIYNIGNNEPVKLAEFINVLESLLDKKAIKEFLPMQPGDVEKTFADISDLQRAINFNPNTPLEVGLKEFVTWYGDYYKKS